MAACARANDKLNEIKTSAQNTQQFGLKQKELASAIKVLLRHLTSVDV